MPSNNATQTNIQIAGIRDGIAILKTGGYRMVLQVSATNFALKSEEEQNSIIFQYQSFLNSLHFPIEVVMQSKKLDLSPYLKKIKDQMEKQQNELLRVQMQDYMEFVSKLINIANIMKKTFFVVIPYEPLNLKNVGLFDKLFGGGKAPDHLKISETEFSSHKDELVQRANVVASGLGSMGLHCIQLNTEQIIELFYRIYNPEIAGKERIDDMSNLTSQVVSMKQPVKEGQDITTQEQVIDNSALVMEAQKQNAQQQKMKEMQAGVGGTPTPENGQKIENRASGLNTAEPSAEQAAAPEQQPPSQ